MTSAQLVRKVLQEACRDLQIEDLDDGGAVVRDRSVVQREPMTGAPTSFPASDTLYRCADILADSGFAVALIRDERGVYLNAQ
ncbi:MAG: hypothetical protein AB7P40_31910 [Chloroflexota bacterium]